MPFFAVLAKKNQDGNTLHGRMAGTRTKGPLLVGFGGVLRDLHDQLERKKNRSVSFDAVARTIRKQHPHLVIGGPTLWRWTQGQVRSPDPLVLRALATVYGVEYSALLAVLDQNRVDAHLSVEDAHVLMESHGARTSSPPPLAPVPEEPDTPADSVLVLAARLIDTGEQLFALAESILGRHLSIARDLPAENDADAQEPR